MNLTPTTPKKEFESYCKENSLKLGNWDNTWKRLCLSKYTTEESIRKFIQRMPDESGRKSYLLRHTSEASIEALIKDTPIYNGKPVIDALGWLKFYVTITRRMCCGYYELCTYTRSKW